ncbi:MAG: OsmC family protein [Thermoguttaceae bacterium]
MACIFKLLSRRIPAMRRPEPTLPLGHLAAGIEQHLGQLGHRRRGVWAVKLIRIIKFLGKVLMSEYITTISWQRNRAVFSDNRYSRKHVWTFDGGAEVSASASPHVVPIPLSDPTGVDPEEAFVAAISSCQMLWFLSIACQRGFVVESYSDKAVGIMAKNNDGKLAITRVTLRPQVVFAGPKVPDESTFHEIHEDAHRECFIANSVRSKVLCDPTMTSTA